MNKSTLHPNSVILLEAWERMQAEGNRQSLGPKTSDHPDLVDCLFVLEQSGDGTWLFSNAGRKLSRLLGRDLGEQSFLDFWTGHDRAMIGALLASVQESRLPATMKARGETLVGVRLEIELTFAPLASGPTAGHRKRLLGLYQPLSGSAALLGRPLWRHRLISLQTPRLPRDATHLRLVASND